MSNSEPKARTKVSTIWTSIILDGELPARIKIVKGEATVRMFGLDAPVPGVFEPEDIAGVISALDQQLEDNEAKYLALPHESFEDQCRDDNYGLISDSELEEQIKTAISGFRNRQNHLCAWIDAYTVIMQCTEIRSNLHINTLQHNSLCEQPPCG